MWRVADEQIDWFVFDKEQFERLTADVDGLLKSRSFPGLWLDPTALIRNDVLTLLSALNRGLASPEHAAFVARLADARTPTP